MARRLAGSIVALLGAGTAIAHHSRVNFLNETVAFEGEIVRFDWANPHSHYVAGRNSSGQSVEWEIESSSTPESIGRGKRVVERYRPADDGATLAIEFSIEDPEYLTAPVTGANRWRYAPDLELLPNKCDLDVAHRYLDGQ